MDVASITQIRELRDSIRDQIKSVSRSDFDSTTYGTESEYDFRGIVGGIDAMLTDLSSLTRAPNKFIKISVHTERSHIVQHLTQIDTHFDRPPNYLPNFEALKVILRGYGVRNFSERQLEFEKEIGEVLKLKLQLQEELVEVKKIRGIIDENETSINEVHESSNEKLEKIDSELEGLITKKDELVTQSESLGEKNDEVEEIRINANNRLEEIKDSATESKSNEKLINSFATRVEEREKRLTELEQRTKDNSVKLTEYEEERKGILEEAEELIQSAKQALNYKTAEGISASFQEQYAKASNWKLTTSWIIGALICLGVTIGLGTWVLDATTNGLGIIIGRVSLLPFPIIGAIFCANQYTKQKNIIEDYAYKMVLSKAIVGFSEQLKENATGNNEEYIHYIKTALGEIHKDPLRKRESKSVKKEDSSATSLKDLVEVAEKIVNMSKTSDA
jgi:hypothetical protein